MLKLILSVTDTFRNKKAPAETDALLEELAGTAPASAGLSWLVFYRLSLFWVS